MNKNKLTDRGISRLTALLILSSFLCLGLFQRSAQADLLGVEPLGTPLITNIGGPGDMTYNASTGLLSIRALPQTIFGSSVLPPTTILAPKAFSIQIVLNENGEVTGGNPGSAPDLVIIGNIPFSPFLPGSPYSGILLTGSIQAFGFLNQGGTTDRFDMRFTVTGGALTEGPLAPMYLGNDLGVTVTMEQSTFDDFKSDFSGLPKVNVGTIPGPCTGSIGDFVWHDLNRDGIQDPGEPGIDGVKVTLQDGTGAVIGMTLTGPNGFYEFTGLCAGDYRVTVDETTLPPNFVPSPEKEGGDPTVDSNGSPEDVNLPTDDSHDPTIDFGYHSPCTGSIGDFVWHDLNRDGIQDPGEPGIDGVKVNLKDDMGAVIAMTITGPNGFYEFTGLCAGDYTVTVDETTLPPDFVPSPDKVGPPPIDSNGSPEDVTLPTDDSHDPTIDFGYYSPCTGSIGDFVWFDTNQDGIQDPGEPGIDNVKVSLENAVGAVIAMTTTDSNGFYQFSGLCAGDYRVIVDETTLPPSLVPSPSKVGGDPTIDSNGSPEPVTLPTDNTDDPTIDFGYHEPAECSLSIDKTCQAADAQHGSDFCVIEEWFPSCYTIDGEITSLTFKYTGGPCPGSNGQPDTAQCQSTLDGTQPVYVDTATGYLVSAFYLQPGDLLTVTHVQGAFNPRLRIELSNYDGRQRLGIVTSCAEPLKVGDVFGALALQAINGNKAEAEVTYNYLVENTGNSDLSLDSVFDDQLGELLIPAPQPLPAGDKLEISRTTILDMDTTNTVVAIGSIGANQCQATDSTTVIFEDRKPCAVETSDFELSQPNKLQMTLTNNGTTKATIDRIVIYWPDDMLLHTIDFNARIFNGTLQPPAASIESFSGGLAARELAPGASQKLVFGFSMPTTMHNAMQDFMVTVIFKEQCYVSCPMGD